MYLFSAILMQLTDDTSFKYITICNYVCFQQNPGIPYFQMISSAD